MKFSAASLFAFPFLACALMMPPPSHADNRPLSREEVEAIVKKVIEENPELIMKSVESFQEKMAVDHISKAAKNLVLLQDKIAHDPRSPVTGNPKGDVTVAVFFDYHCGYCKHFYMQLAQLMKEDKNVRIVFKEFPILSRDSELASKAALAVWNIDKKKYFDFHSRLMQSSGDFTEESLLVMATQVGVNADTFKEKLADPELQKDLDTNKALAKDLAITGTPATIVGTEFVPGAISYDKLKSTVDEVRGFQKHPKKKKKED